MAPSPYTRKGWARDKNQKNCGSQRNGSKALLRMDLGTQWVKESTCFESQRPEKTLNEAGCVSGSPGWQASGIWNSSCCHSPGINESEVSLLPMEAHRHLITAMSALTSSWTPDKALKDTGGCWAASFLPDPLPNHDFASVPQLPEGPCVKTERACRTRILLPSWGCQHPSCLEVPEGAGWGGGMGKRRSQQGNERSQSVRGFVGFLVLLTSTFIP